MSTITVPARRFTRTDVENFVNRDEIESIVLLQVSIPLWVVKYRHLNATRTVMVCEQFGGLQLVKEVLELPEAFATTQAEDSEIKRRMIAACTDKVLMHMIRLYDADHMHEYLETHVGSLALLQAEQAKRESSQAECVEAK